MAPSMAELADSILLATDAIPAGQVSTYGDIAKGGRLRPAAGGRVLAGSGGQTCWWRVVRADGTIAEHLVARGVAPARRGGRPRPCGDG